MSLPGRPAARAAGSAAGLARRLARYDATRRGHRPATARGEHSVRDLRAPAVLQGAASRTAVGVRFAKGETMKAVTRQLVIAAFVLSWTHTGLAQTADEIVERYLTA